MGWRGEKSRAELSRQQGPQSGSTSASLLCEPEVVTGSTSQHWPGGYQTKKEEPSAASGT